MKKKLMLGLVVSGLLLGISGCFEKKEKIVEPKQVFSRVEAVELETMDISLATDGYSQNVLNNTNEGLFRFGKEEKLLLAGAYKMNVSKDGLTYTFTLNNEAKWSDGKIVTAKDYVYSWQRTVNPETGSQVASLLFPIKNAEKIYSGKLSPKELGVEAVSDYQLVVTLENPTPYFESLLAYRGSSCNCTKNDHRIIQRKHKNVDITVFLCFSSKKIRIIPISNRTKSDHRISKDEHSQLSARFNARNFPFSRSLSY